MTMTTTRPADVEPVGYSDFYDNLRNRMFESRERAVRSANVEMLLLYWRTGSDLIARDDKFGWGTKAARRISQDVHREFSARGWGVDDIVRMRQFAEAWPDCDVIINGTVGALPWRHISVLLDLLDTREARDRYAAKAVKHGWSVKTLTHAIEQEPRGRLTECLVQRRDGNGDLFTEDAA